LVAPNLFQTLVRVASFADITTVFRAAREPSRIGRDGQG